MRIADALASYLADLDLRCVFGVGGANIEPLFHALHRQQRIRIVLAKHEAAAVNMAEGHFRKSGRPGVVLVTSGGGAFHTLAPMTEARVSGIPMLVIAGQVARAGEGRGGFQDSSGRSAHGHPPIAAEAVFATVAVAVARLGPEVVPASMLDTLLESALRQRGPAVLLVPRDAFDGQTEAARPTLPPAAPLPAGALDRLAGWLAQAARPLLILGKDVAYFGALPAVQRLVDRLGAVVAVTADGKGLWDHRAENFAGVVGIMGHASAEAALAAADLVLALGTALSEVNRPSRAALGGKPFVSLHRVPSFIGRAPGHDAPALDVQVAELGLALEHLLAVLPAPGRSPRRGWTVPEPCRSLALDPPDMPGMVPMRAAIEALDEAYADADVFVDAGNAGAAAIHYLRPRGRALFSVALGMGAMGHSFGCAIGAAFAGRPGRRSLVIAGDGAYFMHGMEIHTAWQHGLPITFALFNNNGHAMCHLRENLYVGRSSGDHLFKPSRLAEGLAAMLPGLPAYEVDSVARLNTVLAELSQQPGPAVIALQVSPDEMPPFKPFIAARGAALR